MDEIEEVIKDFEDEIKDLVISDIYLIWVEELVKRIEKIKEGLRRIEYEMEYKKFD